MPKLLQVLFLSSLLLMTACGGGSSGGGGSGTYSGTFSLSVNTGSGIVRETGTFTATVNGDSITVTFDDGTVFSGKLGGSAGAKTGALTENIAGVVDGCTSGTISIQIFLSGGPEISGLISGDNVVCNGAGVSIFGTLNGTRT